MSKLGVQCQSGTLQDFPKLLAKKPIAIKLLGNAVNLGIAKDIRRLSPATKIVLRAQADNWSLDAGVVDYANRAMHVADPFQQAGVCDILEPPNEPVVLVPETAKRLNDQMVQCANIYKQHGYKPLAYQFSVGNPSYDLWQYLNDGVVASDGWLGLHEYGAPTLQSNSADLALRHRKMYPLLSSAARANLKVVITECGIDLGIIGQSGGYRSLPSQGDENWWITNLTSQLAWWDAELAKDAYVVATTLYGYAMEHPWETFDVARVDTDRTFFINWLQSGTTPPPDPNPPGEHMEPTPSQTVAIVPFLVKASVQPKYGAGGLGQSLYGQYDAVGDGNELWHCWIFLRGGLKVKDGNYADFSGVKLFNPIDGVPLAEPLPWPNSGPTPPPTPVYHFPQVMTDNGACGEEGKPITGKPFYRINGATIQQGISAFANIVVQGKNGPKIGVQVVNVRPDGKGEVFSTGADGSVNFNFGAASAFSIPCTGPFTIFMAEGAVKNPDTKIVTWVNKLSDIAMSLGDWQAAHTEWRVQFIEI